MEAKSSAEVHFPTLVKQIFQFSGCSGSISTLKAGLEKATGIYRNLFFILYEDDTIDPEQLLHDLNSDLITVVLQEGPMINITFELKDNPIRKRSIKMISENTMSDLMQLIEEDFCIPTDQQILSLNGNTLSAGTLGSQSVTNGSAICVSAKPFEIKLKLSETSQFSVPVNALLTVDQLRAKLKELKPELKEKVIHFEGMHVGQQLGQIRVDDKKAYKTTILDSAPGNVEVRTLTGQLLKVSIDLSESTYALKEKIRSTQGCPAEQQRLIYAGKQLEDEMPLSQYEISNGCTIHMVLRLRGC